MKTHMKDTMTITHTLTFFWSLKNNNELMTIHNIHTLHYIYISQSHKLIIILTLFIWLDGSFFIKTFNSI